MFVIGEDLLGAFDSTGGPVKFDGIRAQVDGDVQAVFEDVQVLVPGAEQGLNMRSDFDTFLHSVLASASVRRVQVLDGWIRCGRGGVCSAKSRLRCGGEARRNARSQGASNCHYG